MSTLLHRSRALALAALVLAAACTDGTPTDAPARLPEGPQVQTQIACTVAVADGTVRCGDPAAEGGAAHDVIVGGQGTFVRLSSANPRYDPATAQFSVDVTVQNLLSQAMGTPDGTTVSGVRVFFNEMPAATVGAGEVTVQNADGEGSFTGVGQPYHAYPQIVQPRGASTAKTWRFGVPSTVERFRFTVYVHARLPAEQGVLRWLQEEGTASSPVADVRGVWGASATDVFAVGRGRILHFDGTSWQTMTSGTRALLQDVWGESRNALYAVGDSGTVLRYDGNRWSRVAGPVPERFLRTVWGHGDTLWVTGYDRDADARMHGLILRSVNGGQSWTETHFPAAVGSLRLWGLTRTGDGTLLVTGFHAGTARGVDDVVVLRSADGGETWTQSLVSAPLHRRMYRVWSHGSTVVAVGEGSQEGTTAWQGVTLRSTDGGVTWTEQTHATPVLFGVWGTAPNNVTAVGFGGTILHFDGTSWTDVRPAGSTADYYAAWGTGAGDVFVMGNGQALARRTADGWVLAPPAGTIGREYVAAWGPAPDDLYVVARSYDNATNRWGTALLRRTNGTWTTIRPRQDNLELSAVWGSGPDNVLVVGHRYNGVYEGVILRWDGNQWTETVSNSGPDRRLNDVHGDGAGNVWVVGHHQDASTLTIDALVMRSENGGATWQPPVRIPVPGHTPQLFGVWVAGPTEVHAVGIAFQGVSYGLRMRYDGTQWHQAVEATPSALGTVWGTGDGTVYAGGHMGGNGLILTSVDHGLAWTPTTFAPVAEAVLPQNATRTVEAFWSASPGVVYAGGHSGPLLQLEGGQWRPVGPLTPSIHALWGFSAGDVWALGASGTVIHGTR